MREKIIVQNHEAVNYLASYGVVGVVLQANFLSRRMHDLAFGVQRGGLTAGVWCGR